MTDPRDIEPQVKPAIQLDQEMHPPKRHDDPEAVVDEEERFGMAVPLSILLISVVFVIVIALYWMD
jgi:hypothetical protein